MKKLLYITLVVLISCGGNKTIKNNIVVTNRYKIDYIIGEYEIVKIDSTKKTKYYLC